METIINIKDLKTAYKYKTDKELRYTHFIFKTLQSPKLVKLLTGCANGIIKYNLPFNYFIKQTVFKIFCAGENIEEAFNTIHTLQKYNVKSVLDYVSEGEKNDKAFILNANIITANIIKLGKDAPGNYVSVKLSGLEDPEFFRKLNDVSFANTKEAKDRFEIFLNRLDLICKTAYQQKVIVYIDAEDRFMQDIFDKITEDMMEKYNKEGAIIFNTLQMYLKDRLVYLDHLIKNGKEKKYIPGIKLVRGAYVEKEREAAREENKESPIHDTKNHTDVAFNQAMEKCLSEFNFVDTCIASHNDESTLLAMDYIKKYNIVDHQKKVRFSQLYGMSDHLTFNLAAIGYNTSKYLPYGEVKKAIPYLIRRSEENSSINGQLSGEVIGLKTEIIRRRSTN